ncbi:MAG: glutamate formimidoyltransferase [Euryarchaeota archaeon]|jgi:glutamate formiminotransferase/formiminotetrahydrofolate cyclodeaminase|nr:glutamate formimidoyltransferase [Euryarchaeota archaeon]MBT5994267.1 glutamate formimidoyltransferase [Candidatus Neomarinimicrobiota bacterium]MBT3757515.1 glutamate formimidoyltransferase [Euryarchaeota archaeon]MBT4050607.1 glutamate formimidoyltransferase [Euryarchaeota archaeon]MBT4650739.1 glutamate formimidoyltransferase [Euryarchaeota archaeon]|tara:strand:- start:5431 stop:6477 length:1047 start_codon:yes stop_codon:yes gene_type:complete
MSNHLIECVPNISEGRDQDIIEKIVGSAKGIEGAYVLGAESDPDYNRTVITIAGEPEAVLIATSKLILKSIELIDMRKHKGSHPRMGAVDVCPFVPLSNNSTDECIRCAKKLPSLIPNIPYYYYGDVASNPSRNKLSILRRGQYEGLESRLTGGDWEDDSTRLPDGWGGEWDLKSEKFGAMSIGVRNVLVAYNVNVDEIDAKASKIAGSIVRSSGRLIKNSIGNKQRIKGMLDEVQAMGLTLPSHNISQVSMNLQNVNKTPMHHAFEAVKSIVGDHGTSTLGSELVGLIPLSAIVESGKWYHSNPEHASEMELVDSAITGLGLDYLSPFNKNKNIIEWAIRNEVEQNE